MKKSLLSLVILFLVLFANAQVALNELYTDPQSGADRQFFELYNSGTSVINLDCYTIVAYYGTASQNKGSIKGNTGFIVIDLPNINIQGRSYFVGAGGAAPAVTADGKKFTPDFNWNQSVANLATLGASVKNYRVAGSTYVVTDTTTANLMFFNEGNNTYSIFLFNNGKYVNGFVSGITTSTLPSIPYRQLPDMPLSNNCGITTVKWSNTPAGTTSVPYTEYYGSATGAGHGYYRAGDGLCGLWNKMTVTPSPGTSNASGSSNNSGAITTINENIVCGTTVSFTVSGIIDPNALPLTVELYYDINGNGALDNGDVLQPNSFTITSNDPLPYTNTFTIPNGQKVLLVYRTPLGCVSRVWAPTAASGTLKTTEKNICGNSVEYKISGTTGNISKYSLPITVQLFQDNGVIGTFEQGVDIAIGSSIQTSDTSGSTKSLSIPIENKNDKILIVYQTSSSCFTKAAVPATLTGGLATTQSYFCGQKVDYTINANGDAITYSLPITINLYYDEDGDGELDADLTGKLLGTAQVSAFTSGAVNGSIALADADMGKKIVVQYVTSVSCITAPATAPTIAACVPTANNDYFTAGQHPAHTIKANLYGGNVKWSGELSTTTQDYDTKSSNMAPAVQSGLDSDPGNPSLSNIVYELVTGPVYSTSCTGAGNALFTFYNNGTFSIDRSNNICISQVNFSYRIRNTITSAVSQVATVTVDFSENIVLPVTFTSFNAVRRNHNVELKWETASEENNKGFYIQRNTGGEWKSVAFVFSAAANGNSNTNLSYAYNDPNSLKGVSQYRILQVDIDGKGKYSEIRSVRGEEQAAKVVVFPNPSAGKLNVMFEDALSVRDIQVMDIAGRVVRQYVNVTSNSITIDNLRDGFYNIQVTDRHTGVSTVEKAVVKKR